MEARNIPIAITDDHGRFRNTLKKFLTDNYNIDVVAEAGNGVELLEQLKTTSPKVLLLDIVMPVMDGIDTLSIVNKLYPDIKVIMLSSFANHASINKLMQMGAFAYLTKEAEPAIIYETILASLESENYIESMSATF